MSDTVQIAFITMMGGIFTGLIAAIPSYFAYRKSQEAVAKVSELKVTVDGRLQQLLEATEAKARAEGMIEGGKAEGVLGEARRVITAEVAEAAATAAVIAADAAVTVSAVGIHARDNIQANRDNTEASKENTEARKENTAAIQRETS